MKSILRFAVADPVPSDRRNGYKMYRSSSSSQKSNTASCRSGFWQHSAPQLGSLRVVRTRKE